MNTNAENAEKNIVPSPPKSQRKFRLTKRTVGPAIIIALVVVIALLWFVLPKKKDTAPSNEAPAQNVVVEEVKALDELLDTFVLPGVIEPNYDVEVAAEVDGRIERILCQEGQACKKGDILIELNTDLLQAAYDMAKAQAEFDQRDFERVTEASKLGVATPNEVDQARNKAAVSKASLESAKATLERATIIAPISGILNKVPVDEGEYVMPGTIVAEIVDVDKVLVVVDVPERDVSFLKVGNKEKISVDINGKRDFIGEITYISEIADIRTRTSRVEITVDNAPDENGKRFLRSGQIVRVRLTRQILKNVVMVPLEAVIPLEEGYVVYVANDSKANRRQVKLGIYKGRSIQILEGLDKGEKLIVSGQRFVGPGQKVNVTQSK